MIKNKLKILRLFIHFLKDNDCYEKYFFYVNNDKYFKNTGIFLSRVDYPNSVQFLLKSYTQNFIRGGFSWAKTKEGYEYFSDIANKWDKFINKNKLY